MPWLRAVKPDEQETARSLWFPNTRHVEHSAEAIGTLVLKP